MRYLEVENPEPGDWALHKGNRLDARKVAKVEGDLIWIYIDEVDVGPYPKENYTYSRES